MDFLGLLNSIKKTVHRSTGLKNGCVLRSSPKLFKGNFSRENKKDDMKHTVV